MNPGPGAALGRHRFRRTSLGTSQPGCSGCPAAVLNRLSRRDGMRDSMSESPVGCGREVVSAVPGENELFSAVDALLEQVPADELPPPAERRRLREAAGLSQTQIATALGTRREAVGNWEAGRTEPRPPQRAAYVRLLEGLAARFPAPVTEAAGHAAARSVAQGDARPRGFRRKARPPAAVPAGRTASVSEVASGSRRPGASRRAEGAREARARSGGAGRGRSAVRARAAGGAGRRRLAVLRGRPGTGVPGDVGAGPGGVDAGGGEARGAPGCTARAGTPTR